jgi:hypothetical protein
MNEFEEAHTRKLFQEAVARYQRAAANPGTVYADRWLAASQASEQAGKLAEHWREVRDLWFEKANEAVPEDRD